MCRADLGYQTCALCLSICPVLSEQAGATCFIMLQDLDVLYTKGFLTLKELQSLYNFLSSQEDRVISPFNQHETIGIIIKGLTLICNRKFAGFSNTQTATEQISVKKQYTHMYLELVTLPGLIMLHCSCPSSVATEALLGLA